MIGLQLWSVKDDTAKDFVGTLEALALMGYDGVEFAGYGGIPAAAMRSHLDRLGLKAAGSHVGLEKLKAQLADEIAYAHIVGAKHLTCPGAKPNGRAGYLELAEFLNKTGKILHDEGITLSYHNHGWEFEDFSGTTGLDLLWQNTDPALVQVELDLFWVKFAGLDPLTYLKSLGKRVALLHYKDMDRKNPEISTIVGTGSIDFVPITRYAQNLGIEWLIIEQEEYDRPPLECVKLGVANLKKLL